MAALGSTQFAQCAFPLSNPPFCNSHSARSLNASGSQKRCGPAATSSRSSQIEADRSTAARATDHKHVLINNDDETDDDFPSLEELSRAALRPKISTQASKTGPTIQYPKHPALQRAGLQVDRTQFRLSGQQGSSRDQPVILDDDDDLDEADITGEAEGASSDVNAEPIEWDASLHDALTTSELASAPTESIDTSDLWYDVEADCSIEDPAPGLGPHEQYGLLSTPVQAQSQTLPQSSAPQQDQTNQQGMGSTARSASPESTLHSLLKPSDGGDDEWTEEDTAELEKELGLAGEKQQVDSSPACTPPYPSLHSVEAPQHEIQSRERSETTGSRPEELQETEVVVEGGATAMKQQEELGQQAVGDEQDLVEVDFADDPADKEATEALPATQPEIDEIDKHRFRLRGVRARQLAGRQTKTTQYRVVWGEHPIRSDSWLNEDDVQISILRPTRELSSQNLALSIDTDTRVYRMRPRLHKGRKLFDYLVDAVDLDDRTWITEDQLRISLSPMLVLELKGSSPHPLSEAQRDILLRHSATPIRDEHCHVSRASRSCSAPADSAVEGEPTTRKRGHQDVHTEISSDTHHSANTDDNHDAYDTSDEDPRPAKRRKPRPAPAATPTTSRRHTPELHVGPLVTLSTATPEINDAQPQIDHERPSTFVDTSRPLASRTSRNPSAASEAAPVAEYQEWPFQGFLKRTRIRDDVTYNLEFKLPSISEHLHLPINSAALDINHDAAAYSKRNQAPLKPKKSKWTEEEDIKLLQMWNEGRSWEYIFAALPGRSEGTIRVRCSTRFGKRSRTGADRS